jgi:protein required for attachment to host cells
LRAGLQGGPARNIHRLSTDEFQELSALGLLDTCLQLSGNIFLSYSGDFMLLPQGTIVAVADGEKFNLFRNSGDEAHPALTAMSEADIESVNAGSGAGHQSSSANPDESQAAEDGFAGGIAGLLNKRVLDGEISDLVIIAAPRTLGELRKNYHKKLSEVLRGEISKDLTGHALHDIEKAIAAA